MIGIDGIGGPTLDGYAHGQEYAAQHAGASPPRCLYGRIAGYEDANDADYPRVDPAMRRLVGGRAETRLAASASEMGRFETKFLAIDENPDRLARTPGSWIDAVHARAPLNHLVLDMGSSESPTHGEQEGTVYNAYFGCTCYHPLFCFNQSGDVGGRAASGKQRTQRQRLARCA